MCAITIWPPAPLKSCYLALKDVARVALPLLSEEDVPGASFIHAKIEKHSVDQLRRWLACHGINTLGNKTARQKSTMK